MKRWLLTLLAVCCLGGCSSHDDDLIDCQIYWQLYHTPKHLEETEIEKTFRDTFYGFYEPLNENTVIARNTTTHDVRSLTRKLASMADAKLDGTTDPQLDYRVEVRVYVNFDGKYVEEVWSKMY